jgi:hypothetical protein
MKATYAFIVFGDNATLDDNKMAVKKALQYADIVFAEENRAREGLDRYPWCRLFVRRDSLIDALNDFFGGCDIDATNRFGETTFMALDGEKAVIAAKIRNFFSSTVELDFVEIPAE